MLLVATLSDQIALSFLLKGDMYGVRGLNFGLVGTLASTAAGGGAHSPVPSPDGHPGTPAGTLLVTATGTVYHRAGCPVTAHHPEDVRVAGAADLSGLHPCQICSPGSESSVVAPSFGG